MNHSTMNETVLAAEQRSSEVQFSDLGWIDSLSKEALEMIGEAAMVLDEEVNSDDDAADYDAIRRALGLLARGRRGLRIMRENHVAPALARAERRHAKKSAARAAAGMDPAAPATPAASNDQAAE